ncbi:MAG TPA: hypothetical protein VEL76_17755, partial [Gemmataceae bacterium]|nr:hypothetical protein [Gemmataceae bacterium]
PSVPRQMIQALTGLRKCLSVGRVVMILPGRRGEGGQQNATPAPVGRQGILRRRRVAGKRLRSGQ